MRETWVGTCMWGPFRVFVKMGRIVGGEGMPPWAKGLRIRQFKREIWKGTQGHVEQEIDEIESKGVDLPDRAEDSVGGAGPSEGAGGAYQESLHEGGSEDNDSQAPPPDPKPGKTRETGRQLVTMGTSLKDALKIARGLGCHVRPVRRKGEVRISHPLKKKKRINANARKKDAPKNFISYLNQLSDLLES